MNQRLASDPVVIAVGRTVEVDVGNSVMVVRRARGSSNSRTGRRLRILVERLHPAADIHLMIPRRDRQ
jgi:hypothetical protein